MLEYTKIQKLLLVIIIGLSLLSCENNKVELTQEEYKRLIGDTIKIKPEYPKHIKIYSGIQGQRHDLDGDIYLSSNGHDYLIIDHGYNSQNVEHYIECQKCKKDTI